MTKPYEPLSRSARRSRRRRSGRSQEGRTPQIDKSQDIAGITVYRDDENFNVFFPFAHSPRYRLDDNDGYENPYSTQRTEFCHVSAHVI